MRELENKIDEILKLAKEMNPPVKRIGVQEGNSVYLLPVDEICFISTGEEAGLEFYTVDGKKYINFDSLTGLDKKLSEDPKFMKVHKSFMVNLKTVSTIETVPGGRDLKFKAWPDKTVKCAQTYVKELEQYFKL